MRMSLGGMPLASKLINGLLSAANWGNINNFFGQQFVNVIDFGADPTGAADSTTAIQNAINSLSPGGTVWLPGSFKVSGTLTLPVSGLRLRGSSRGASTIITTAATGDVVLINGWNCAVEDLQFQCTVARTSGYYVNAPTAYPNAQVRNCIFSGGSTTLTFYNGILMGSPQMEIDTCLFQYFSNVGISINATTASNQYISNILMNNATQAVAGIQILQMASLLLDGADIITSGVAMDIANATGTSIPSIEAMNCFFDTSSIGLRFNSAGTGNVVRSRFTSCWFGNQTTAGIQFTGSGAYDGISFVNCDFYNNANGIIVSTGANYWSIANSRFAGNTTAAINITASSASQFPQLLNNSIQPQAGFGANGTGIIVPTATFAGLVIQGNVVQGNTTNLTLGTVTVANWANYRICDNAGINPRGTVTTPTFPASAVVVTNTTGFRVVAYLKGGVISAISVNGVATALATATPITLDPGGTVAVTWSTTSPTWVWVGS